MAKINNYYLSEIGKIPLLSLEEEKALATKAKNGDKSAQKKLVESNLRLVIKIAGQYESFMEMDDLINEGNMGLMHAAEKFDPDNGNKFSTYAVWWIKAYIQKAIRETSTGIRFPANKYDEMKKSKWKIASLDKQISESDDEGITLMDMLKDERIQDPVDEFWGQYACNELQQLLGLLNKNEKVVISMRYGLGDEEPMSLSEIGTLLGYSKERVRQIEKNSIKKMKEFTERTREGFPMAA